MTTPNSTARAHVSRPGSDFSTSFDVAKTEQAHKPRPGCIVCDGTGKFHHQVPGEFRVVTRDCQCWRLA